MMEHEIHGKLTGAGGGGCVIGFPKDPRSVDFAAFKQQIEAQGFTILEGVEKSDLGYQCTFD